MTKKNLNYSNKGTSENYSVSPYQHAHPLLCSFSGTAASGIP